VTLDIGRIREAEFPWAARGDQIFLNHAGTGPLPARTIRRLAELEALRGEPWRFDAELQFGTLDRSRELCAGLIGASPDEIALMVNTSYGLNLAARALPLAPGDVVVVPDREFPANMYPWLGIERSRGAVLRRIPCRGRLLDEEALLRALDEPRVRICAVSWISFETGMRADLATISAACRERGIHLVVDGIQGVGTTHIDVRALGIDVLACGAQKWLLAPWGSGFVYVRRELVQQLEPQDVGWMSCTGTDDFSRMLEYSVRYRDNARRFEVITLPYQDFGGLNASLSLFYEVGIGRVVGLVEERATQIVEWAQRTPGMTLVTPPERERRAGTIAVVPPDPVAASRRLEVAGVAHSLREGAIRLSPHFYTTAEELERALHVLGHG
jgi:cysteine desulfurase / selenocysteine lyase